MNRSRSSVTTWMCALALMVAGAAQAAPGKGTVAIFLPTSLDDGKARFDFGEELAQRLGEELGLKLSAKNFARYDDFAKALRAGQADYAVVDAWSASGLKGTVVAMASRGKSAEERWVVVSSSYASVKDLKGKRLALARGSGAADTRFVNHVVFGGDLEATRHFKLVQVPNVESALKALEAKSADAALLPASQAPKGARVVYRSEPEPGAVVLQMKGDGDDLLAALKTLGAVAPFEAFVPARKDSLSDFNRRILRGVPARQPVLAETPTVRPDTGVFLELGEVGLVLPSFVEDLEVEPTLPDD